MKGKILRTLILFFLLITIASCSSKQQNNSPSFSKQQNYPSSNLISKKEFLAGKDSKGVVLMAVNWGRKWKCGGFENAELRNLGFDLLPIQDINDALAPSLTINGPQRLTTTSKFINYAFLLEPGEYALSYINIKVAQSASKVGYFTANKSKLLKNKKPQAGTFHVKPGEVVYIGNFWLDCAYSPVIWRYYTEGKETFNKHLQEFAIEHPYLNLTDVQYRLFDTDIFGIDYQLKD